MEDNTLRTLSAAPDFAPGFHALIDLWGSPYGCDVAMIERALRDAAAAGGATVLNVYLHGFGEGAGLTGVALLAESHITVHTWPEMDYIALDVFMCGDCDVQAAADALLVALSPARHRISSHPRG